MASTSRSATWSGDSRFSLIMNVGESYVSGGADNYSWVDWNIQLSSTSGYRTWTSYAENPLTVYVNGSQVYNANITYDLQGNTITVASGSTKITHNSDGSKTIGFSASFTDVSNGKGSASLSGDLALTKINRYAVTNSVTGTDNNNIEENFSVNYTKYINSWSYKLRISRPGVEALERIDYNTSGTSFKLSQESINKLYDLYGPDATFNLGFAVETWSGSSKLSDGNEKTISCRTTSKGRIRIGGVWKNATLYVRSGGEWKKATPYIRNNNEWKRGK